MKTKKKHSGEKSERLPIGIYRYISDPFSETQSKMLHSDIFMCDMFFCF